MMSFSTASPSKAAPVRGPKVVLGAGYRGVRVATGGACTAPEPAATLRHMNRLIPFCEECGDPRVLVSGEHPGEAGIVRWAMYACGHTRTAIEFDGVPADDDDLLPVVLPRRV